MDKPHVKLVSEHLQERAISNPWETVLKDRKVPGSPAMKQTIQSVILAITQARSRGKAVIAYLGGHTIKTGAGRYVADLMRSGWLTCVGGCGAVLIHDYELGRFGGTGETVSQNLQDGSFGMREPLNSLMKQLGRTGGGWGLGDWAGNALIAEVTDGSRLQHSVLATGHRCRVPVTIHTLIGGDILAALPDYPAAVIGETSHADFLRFAQEVARLDDGGVYLSFGSAVHSPEVFLKALSLARNLAHQEGRTVRNFTVVVVDIQPIDNYELRNLPQANSPLYYNRSLKTLIHRAVQDSGRSYYINGWVQDIWSILHTHFIGSTDKENG